MIIMKLWGGLGNQMFQYALGYCLSRVTGQELWLDTDFFENQPSITGKRKIDIEKLNIPVYNRYKRNAILHVLNNRYVGGITRNLPRARFWIGENFWYFKEPLHKYVAELKIQGDIYLDGYWQSSRYFQSHREELLILFQPKESPSEEVSSFYSMVAGQESVAVHMRKGDFGSGSIRKVGHLLEDVYYKSAIEYCREHLKQPRFYVFSDDCAWARRQLGGAEDIFYVAEKIKMNSIEDLFGMAHCRHGIMSASTFSWWGNWLRREKGLVIAPKGNYYNEFFFEDEWVRL